MRLDDARALFIEMIRDVYSAETQLTLALPRVAVRAQSESLRAALEDHLRETETHVARLEDIADEMGFSPGGRVCIGMHGILQEGDDAMGYGGDPRLVEAAIICACQKVEHYEIAAYESLLRLAQRVDGAPQLRDTLLATLQEENNADRTLREIAEGAPRMPFAGLPGEE